MLCLLSNLYSGSLTEEAAAEQLSSLIDAAKANGSHPPVLNSTADGQPPNPIEDQNAPNPRLVPLEGRTASGWAAGAAGFVMDDPIRLLRLVNRSAKLSGGSSSALDLMPSAPAPVSSASVFPSASSSARWPQVVQNTAAAGNSTLPNPAVLAVAPSEREAFNATLAVNAAKSELIVGGRIGVTVAPRPALVISSSANAVSELAVVNGTAGVGAYLGSVAGGLMADVTAGAAKAAGREGAAGPPVSGPRKLRIGADQRVATDLPIDGDSRALRDQIEERFTAGSVTLSRRRA